MNLPLPLDQEVEASRCGPGGGYRMPYDFGLERVLAQRLEALTSWRERGGYAPDTVLQFLVDVALLRAELER